MNDDVIEEAMKLFDYDTNNDLISKWVIANDKAELLVDIINKVIDEREKNA